MLISELIKELQSQMEAHGDIPVEVFASTDGGYSGGGGPIEEIECHELAADSWTAKERGYCKVLTLINNDN